MVLRGRRLTVVLLSVLVALLAGGSLAAMAIGRARSTGIPTGTAPSSGQTGPSRGPTGQTGPSEDTSVQLSPRAAQQPRAEEVRMLLQRYFDSINARDYPTWVDSVTTDQSAGQGQAAWERAYSTTKESSIKVLSIDRSPFRVRLWFTSEQAVEFAPTELRVKCINWQITFPLVEQDGRLVVGKSIGAATRMAACG